MKEIWEKIKAFFSKIWSWLKWVLVAAGGILLALLGVKKKSAEKQITKNNQTIGKIEATKDTIKETIKKTDDIIEKSESVIEEAKKVSEKAKKSSAKDVISKNEEIIEKYKK